MGNAVVGWIGALVFVGFVGCGNGSGGAPDAAMAADAPTDAPASSSSLAALTPSVGALDPPFEPEVTEYVLRLAIGDEAVAFTAVAATPESAEVTVAGVAVASGAPSLPVALSPGIQPVDVVVTAAGGSATTYRVQVQRGEPAIALSYAGGVLDRLTPAFDLETTAYTADVGLWVQHLQITVVPGEAASVVTVNGGPATAGVPTAPFALNLGLTSFTVVITPPAGPLQMYSLDVTRASALVQQAYGKASNSGADDQFGYSVAMWGDTLAVGACYEDSAAIGVGSDQTDNSAANSGAVYVFTRTGSTWSQQAYLKASNTGVGDHFGCAVALWGDTLAVGAFTERSSATGVGGNQADNSADESGAVYVFTRTGSTWSQQAYLKASNTSGVDFFGGAVALWGETLAVGALGEDSAATGLGGNQVDESAGESGAVYVFTRSGTTWSQQAYVKASNTGLNDQFGNSVAIWGDTLAIGAFEERSSATGVGGNQADDTADQSGAVYVFTRTGTTWSQRAYLKASNTGASDRFGESVALWGDTLAVGAFGEDSAATGVGGSQGLNNAAESGAVYVFTRTGTSWSQQAYIKASNTGAGDLFGGSVALWGDTLAVGAYSEASAATGPGGNQADNSASQSGAVYVFNRAGTTWSQWAYLKASNTGAVDYFGSSVALWGDALAVGASREDSAATGVNGDQADNSAAESGAVYVFR